MYWYHVHGYDRLDLSAVRASLAATASQRPWTDLEVALWPVMLAREALRRLATPLAIAVEQPTGRAACDRPALRGRPVGHARVARPARPYSPLTRPLGGE